MTEPKPLQAPLSTKCTLPPPDWFCSRPAGHTGPCAATHIPSLGLIRPLSIPDTPLTERLLYAIGTYSVGVSKTGELAMTTELDECIKAVDAAMPSTVATHYVVEERKRQIEKEGWTQAHDVAWHTPAELLTAAECYLMYAEAYPNEGVPPAAWPWSAEWWKPKGYIRNKVRAAALIIAALDLHITLEEPPEPVQPLTHALVLNKVVDLIRDYIHPGGPNAEESMNRIVELLYPWPLGTVMVTEQP